jgi:tetratricopeptide (TPR) repeat protein
VENRAYISIEPVDSEAQPGKERRLAARYGNLDRMSRLLPVLAVLVAFETGSTVAVAAGDAGGASQKAMIEGDRAAIARDFDTAIAKYRSVVANDPRNAVAHYRIAQAQAMKGDLNEAEQAYFAALRFSGTNDALRAKVLFCIADLRERQKAYEAAVDAWTEYEKQAVKAPDSTPHVAVAAERKNRIAEWKKALAAGAETKARVARRLKELEELARKNAK